MYIISSRRTRISPRIVVRMAVRSSSLLLELPVPPSRLD
jgi:hypothetical protein